MSKRRSKQHPAPAPILLRANETNQFGQRFTPSVLQRLAAIGFGGLYYDQERRALCFCAKQGLKRALDDPRVIALTCAITPHLGFVVGWLAAG